jgi:hypothetical protein
MVTWNRAAGRVGIVAVLLAACGGSAAVEKTPGVEKPPASPADVAGKDPLPGTGSAYDGKGFVVHEWGTNTVVVGSDGSLQRGLHHEEEDLPAFVYDRMRVKNDPGVVEMKMETPVTYFYSAAPLTAQVSVEFPEGVLTQWYPHVASFYPLLADPNDGSGVRDPALDPKYPFRTQTCEAQFGRPAHGRLDWGSVDVLARGTEPKAPEAKLESFTWSHARAVASNPVRVADTRGGAAQEEKFLFYRGLGNSPLPAAVTATTGPTGFDGGVTITNRDKAHPLGAAFVLRVGADKGAFEVHPEGIAPGAALDGMAPALDAASAQPLEAYVDALATSVVAELDKTGLFHDESVAMVNTWRRQWFRTPGVRVLYLANESWTNKQIPLSIVPAPDKMVRVMMIRVEVITPALEDGDAKYATALGGSGAGAEEAKTHFRALGRFAEPRLRRALGLVSPMTPGASAFLAEITTANTSTGLGE